MYYNIHSYTKGTPPFHVNIYIYFSTGTYAPTYIRCCIKDETYTHISYFVVFLFWMLRCIPIVWSAHAEYSFDALKPLKPDRNRLRILF